MLPPGPRTPKAWQTYRYQAEPKAYVRKLAMRYGPAMRYRMIQGTGVGVTSPELAREVFAIDPSKLDTAPIVPIVFGPRAVMSTSGDEHRRQRRLLNPRFHGAHMKALFGTMQRVVDAHLASWTPGGEATMSEVARSITLDVILETVFGSLPGLDRVRAREIMLALVGELVPSVLAMRWIAGPAVPSWRRYEAARRRFDAWVDELVASRRARGEPGDDILGALLEARYDDGAAIALPELCDHLFTLLAAGHETTAVALAWAVYFLARDPVVLERLRREIDALGPDASPEELTRLPYLEAVCAEALRIEPIVTDVSRVCRVPVRVGAWTVPAGETLTVFVGGILGDAKIYEEPDRFRPERFLARAPAATEFLPFGGGSRRCLGAAYAEAELAIAVGTIASRWELTLVDPRPERAVRKNLIMGPERGVRVRVVSARRPARRSDR